MRNKLLKHWHEVILFALLTFLIVLIGAINLSGIAEFYDTDMYSDLMYSMKFWEHRSIFPDGWVFGNQFYVIATPVLAGLIYGAGFDPIIAMGLASTVMTILVVASFYWMISPFFPFLKERLFACIIFVLLPLVGGGFVRDANGWQLLFTMCSYYACYAVTAFLAFGLYIRYWNTEEKINWLCFFIVCLLSFFTGIQSLRQTVIMTLPLIAVEACCFIFRCIKKQNVFTSSLIIAIGISCFNLAGVLFSRFLNINAVQIFGEVGLVTSLLPSIKEAIMNFVLLFSIKPVIIAVGMVSLIGGCTLALLITKRRNAVGAILGVLLLFAVGTIGAIDIFTTMQVRQIYYFMCYPLVAFLSGCILDICAFLNRNMMRTLAQTALIFILIITCVLQCDGIINHIQDTDNRQYEDVSEYLCEDGYTTIYSRWDLCEKIAIASSLNIQAGFWDYKTEPFVEVRYLCDPSVFEAEPTECAYVFKGTTEVEIAKDVLNTHGYSMNLLKYFPESDIYLFTSDVNLILMID